MFLKLRRRFLQHLHSPTADHEIGAELHETLTHALAEAGATARYQNTFAL
jgi:hypothetical protein